MEEEPLKKSGTCVDEESVAACLKCENPAPPPPPPSISTKAEKLAKIMSMACQIPNKSYPKNYVAPTEEEVKNHLLACSPALYPETATSKDQAVTLQKLLDENNDSLRQKMFKGLWYQPPFTAHFESYFGLDGTEAAYVICMNTSSLSGTLYTTEEAMANQTDGGYQAWLQDPKAQARYQATQKIRQQLLSCFNKPAQSQPQGPLNPPPVEKTCEYQSFEGKFEKGGREEIERLLAEGFKVAIEGNQMCSLLDHVPASGDFSGDVKIVGYRCQ